MSFYNTYRPKTFAELNSAKVRTLVTSLLSKKKEDLPHAFLLTGPRGIGKTTTARLIAKYVNCIQPLKNGEPCGICELCLRIANGTALDVMEMDAASNTGVDNIRDLKDKIMLAPAQAEWKVYIIDEVHMLSTGAFNALLKTLEEPPAKTLFILATTDPQKVPETIQSRCLVLPFQKPEISELVNALESIVLAEKLAAEPEALQLIAIQADGSFRDATKLLEQASLASKQITKTDVQTMLSIPQASEVTQFLVSLEGRDIPVLLQQIERLSKEGLDIRAFFVAIIRGMQSRLISQIVDQQTQNWNTQELSRALAIFIDGYTRLKASGMPDIAMELAVLQYCSHESSATKPTAPQTKPVTHTEPAVVITAQKSTPIPTPQAKKEETIPTVATTPVVAEPKKEEVPPLTPKQPMLLTLEKLRDHWADVLAEVKNLNHSISGVLRSTRPKSVSDGIVTIEAFYPFHKDKLSEMKSMEDLMKALKTLFGEKVKVEIVLGKK